MAASSPASGGEIRVPAPASSAPAATSSPTGTTLTPAAAGVFRVTVSAVNSVASKRSTPSAPGGRGAPVRTLAASPGPRGRLGTPPAGISSTTRSVTGFSGEAAARSAVRKA